MPDPGDSTVHEAPNLTALRYTGNNLFSWEEGLYDPMRLAQMVLRWATVAEAHGRLP